MLVTKRLNTNVALAIDADGRELVVFGKGVGFPAVPYELDEQSSSIQRIFRDVDNSLLAVAGTLSPEVLTASLAIADYAANEIAAKLNPNLAFTVADHLQFAWSRLKDGVIVENPLAEEVSYVYPKETKIGRYSLDLFRAITGVELPVSEAAAIALHVVNAEARADDMSFIMQSTTIVSAVIDLIERDLGILVDRVSYSYVRFVTHLRYLIRRLNEGKPSTTANMELFASAKHDFPEECRCARDVADLLSEACGCDLNEDELLYLLLYINRLRSTR